MRTYSIKDLENFTGIKAHTIRIWEQRYSLLSPNRTDTGYRFYNDEDLKKILSISVLLKSGIKISKIASLPKEDVVHELSKIDNSTTVNDSKIELCITNLLTGALNFDDKIIESELSNFQATFTPFEFISKIIYPLLSRIGLMWEIDEITPLQEHFLSNRIRQKLFVEMDKLQHLDKEEFDFVLFLPETETHEIGLLVANYLMLSANIKTMYLGPQVPVSNLCVMLAEKKIKNAFGFIFISPGKEKFKKVIRMLEENCKETNFYWSGSAPLFESIKLGKNQRFIPNIEIFNQEIIQAHNG